MGKKLTVKKRVIVDEGIFSAKVKTVEEKDGKFGSYYRITFKITDEEYEGKAVSGNCPQELEVGNKTYKWVSILLGKELEVDEDFDIDDIIGMPCKVAVEHNSNDEGTFARVTALYKKKKKKDDDDDEDEEEKPKKKKKNDDDDEDEAPKKKKKDEDDDDDEGDEPKKKKKKDDDDDEEEEKPKKKKKDDDDDEDEDEAPKKKKKDEDEDEDEEFK